MVEAFLLSLAPTRNGMYRTGLFTSSAADPLRAVRVFHRVDFHLTCFCTFSTVNALVMVYSVAENGYFIKDGIECTQWADIFTEWTVNNNRSNRHRNRHLPGKPGENLLPIFPRRQITQPCNGRCRTWTCTGK